MPRIGVLGGTFDPIHLGHLSSAEDAAHELALDRILLVPNWQQPFKQNGEAVGAEHRAEMIRRSIADNPLLRLCTVELERRGTSYTIDTLRELQASMEAGTDLFFLIGSDGLADLYRWRSVNELVREFNLVVMCRAGDSAPPWPMLEEHIPGIQSRMTTINVAQLEISSRAIRQRVEEGASIRYLVHAKVREYIGANRLYRSAV